MKVDVLDARSAPVNVMTTERSAPTDPQSGRNASGALTPAVRQDIESRRS